MDNSLKTVEVRKSFGKSLLYTLPMFLITFMFMTGGKPNFSDPASGLAMLTVFLLVNVLYFFMHFTGKTDRKQINCSNLRSGVYIIIIQVNGKQWCTNFIKE